VIAFTSSIYVAMQGKSWQAGTLTLIIFAAVVYPILWLAERWKHFSALFVEKKPGEIRSSLLLLFLSQALFLAFSCGVLKKPYLLVCATASWGLGDIAAAWVGRPLGKHKIRLFFADHSKTWEGSAAMALVSFLASFASLYLFSPCSPLQILVISLIIGIVSSLAEMASTGGNDTVTVPFANLLTLALISFIIR
jgi:dolichol kinase